MTFKEGADSGVECPKCLRTMTYEMSFYDTTDMHREHTTVDVKILECAACGHTEDYEGDDDY